MHRSPCQGNAEPGLIGAEQGFDFGAQGFVAAAGGSEETRSSCGICRAAANTALTCCHTSGVISVRKTYGKTNSDDMPNTGTRQVASAGKPW